MKKVRFRIQVDPEAGNEASEEEAAPRLNEKGMDQVEFLLSPNPGEDLKPLAKIASGGELSRIMLAMKRIFAEESLVKTLIFDEVDAGIGGGIAEIVGRKLKEISGNTRFFASPTSPRSPPSPTPTTKSPRRNPGEEPTWKSNGSPMRERLEEIARMLGRAQDHREDPRPCPGNAERMPQKIKIGIQNSVGVRIQNRPKYSLDSILGFCNSDSLNSSILTK